MILSRIPTIKAAVLGLATMSAMALSSCSDSFIYDDLPECVPEYRVKLSYDRNMAYEERIHLVDAAEIYAFDQDGALAATAIADRATLEANGWSLPIDLKRHQTYDLVVWAGLTNESPFRLDGTRAVTSKEDLVCRLTTETDAAGHNTSKSRLPHLYHGAKTFTFTLEDGMEEQTLPLTKNTNIVKVITRKDSGSPIARNEFPVRLVDKNDVISHDNTLPKESEVIYHPVEVTYGEFALSDGNGAATENVSEGSQSEFHISRLTTDSEPRLQILDGPEGRKIVDIDMMQMIRDLKSKEAPEMDTQEYLDRQDAFDIDITFHVEELYIHLAVIVNGWQWVYYDIEWN